MTMKFDEKGMLVAADVPNAGVARTDPNAKSGNPRHDARSGKFAPGGKAPDPKNAMPNQDPLEMARMLDAVRDAAREFDTPGEGDIREFLAGRAKNPGQVDIANFLNLVNQQRMNDAVDAIDEQMRSGGLLARSRRKVKVAAPKGFLRKFMSSLDKEGLAEIMARLEARGHDRAEVDSFFDGRNKNVEEGKARRDELTASAQQWEAIEPIEFTERLLDIQEEQPQRNVTVVINTPPEIDAEALARQIAENLNGRD